MKLSVIIVNYNVEHFLEQCLNSVVAAMKPISGEVIVIDNNSIDGSVEMVKEKFPQVKIIANKTNDGFSKANNQGIKIAKGEYVLLLNPDTVVEEHTFSRTVDFMDAHPEAGGLGVKMIDGKGHFLPESKRGLPTPAVAFYKMIGLSRLFPKSRRFGKYHLGYLSSESVHEVEILSGAFMLMRMEALEKTGYLDEDFFMYGEDIDMSWRIIKAGYKNYYFPETRIIHYKGESTKKSSVNYVFVFYNAMVIFAKKHFSDKKARLISFLIKIAIYLRASVAIVNRIAKRAVYPLLDFVIILSGIFVLTSFYEEYTHIDLPNDIVQVALPAYAFIWIGSIFLSGGYDKPIKYKRIFQGLIVGTLIILAGYALLDKAYQFSRILILLGSAVTLIGVFFLRLLYHLMGVGGYRFNSNNKRFLIIGDEEETARVTGLLRQTQPKIDLIGYAGHEEAYKPEHYLGRWNQVGQIIHIHKMDELIFCAKNVSAENIISKMASVEKARIDFKIAQPETLFLIGSNSIDTSGDLYMMNVDSINNVTNKRNKRLFDIAVSVVLLLSFPIGIWFIKNKARYLPNLLRVLFGSRSFVGYQYAQNSGKYRLPRIKTGILKTTDHLKNLESEEALHTRLNLIYAKDYRVSVDLNIILKQFSKLGNRN